MLDADLTWASVFEIMERLQDENKHIYSYIVSAIPIDYIYNTILTRESGRKIAEEEKLCCYKYLIPHKAKVKPSKETLANLLPFEKRFNITKLKELPWSVIFNR